MIIINCILLIIYSLIEVFENHFDILDAIVSFLAIIICFLFILRKDVNYSFKKILISIPFTIILTVLSINNFLFNYKLEKITIKNISDEPIIIDAIYKNEKKVKTNHLYNKKYDKRFNASLTTEYKLYNKTDSNYKMYLDPNEKYSISINRIKNIEIDFQRKEKNYSILVNNKKYNIYKYKYQDDKKADVIYNSSYKYKYNNTKRIINILLLLLIIYINFNISIRLFFNKNILLLLPFIIELNNYINISAFSKIFLLLLTLIITYKITPMKLCNKYKIINMLISMYISFSFIGGRIINTSFNIDLFFLYIVLWIYIYYFTLYFLSVIEKMIYEGKITYNKNIKVHRVVVFIMTLLVCILYSYFFHPYILHVDGYMQLNNILESSLSDWHPYFHTIVLGMFYNLFGNLNIYIYFRFVIYSLILNTILFYFNKKGLSIKKIYIISFLITIYPVTGVMLVTLNKDIDFSLALVCLTFYLYLLIMDKKYFHKNILNYIILITSLICVSLFRHNGIYVGVVCLIILLVVYIKDRDILLPVSIIVTSVFIFFIKVPLYNYLKVSSAPRNNDVVQLIHGLDYLVVSNKNIIKDVHDFLNKEVGNDYLLKVSYDKYDVDLLQHYSIENFRDRDIDKLKLIQLYLRQFIKTPVPLIIDRLYGTDQMWNNAEYDFVNYYKYQTKYDEFDDYYGQLAGVELSYNENVNNVLIFIASNELLNLFSFRSGIYIDMLMILLLYCLVKRKEKILIVSIPLIINILTLFISMHHQEYRYIWVIELVFLLMYLIIIYNDKKDYN